MALALLTKVSQYAEICTQLASSTDQVKQSVDAVATDQRLVDTALPWLCNMAQHPPLSSVLIQLESVRSLIIANVKIPAAVKLATLLLSHQAVSDSDFITQVGVLILQQVLEYPGGRVAPSLCTLLNRVILHGGEQCMLTVANGALVTSRTVPWSGLSLLIQRCVKCPSDHPLLSCLRAFSQWQHEQVSLQILAHVDRLFSPNVHMLAVVANLHTPQLDYAAMCTKH